jgi:hypothetical protein
MPRITDKRAYLIKNHPPRVTCADWGLSDRRRVIEKSIFPAEKCFRRTRRQGDMHLYTALLRLQHTRAFH